MTGRLIDICVIGSWKCGSTSLVRYLKDKFPDKWVGKQEVFHMQDEKFQLHNNEPDCIYYVILRRDRANFYHSMHKFFYPEMEFIDFMAMKDVRKTGMSVVQLADWQKHINRWKGKVTNLKIVWLEDIRKQEGFPHMNKTSDVQK